MLFGCKIAGPKAHENTRFLHSSICLDNNRPRSDGHDHESRSSSFNGFFHHCPPFMFAMQQSCCPSSHHTNSDSTASTANIEENANREDNHFEANMSPSFIDFLGVGAT